MEENNKNQENKSEEKKIIIQKYLKKNDKNN